MFYFAYRLNNKCKSSGVLWGLSLPDDVCGADNYDESKQAIAFHRTPQPVGFADQFASGTRKYRNVEIVADVV